MKITKKRFKFCELHPGGAVFRIEEKKLFVENSASLELAKLDLEVDVAAEQLRLRTLPESCAEGATSGVHVSLADFELPKIFNKVSKKLK